MAYGTAAPFHCAAVVYGRTVSRKRQRNTRLGTRDLRTREKMEDRACIAFIEDGQILMVQQLDGGRMVWTFPGGGIRNGESPREAAVREAREEVNVYAKVGRILYRGPRSTTKGEYYCFEGRIVRGEVSLGKDPELPDDAQELQDVRWFPITEVRDHFEVSRILGSIVRNEG